MILHRIAPRAAEHLARRPRMPAIVTAAALVAAVLSSCGASTSASDVTVVEVELGRYTITPSVITAPAGELELRVTNVDVGLVHDLVVASKGTRRLAPGESQTLPVGELAVGEYRMWCDMQGHAQMGQAGVLRIESGVQTATT